MKVESDYFPYTITRITADSLQASDVLQLIWNVFEEFVAYDCSPEAIKEYQNYFEFSNIKQLLSNSKMVMWGCFHDNEIIGMIATKHPCHISLLFVDKYYQRQGVAKALYQKVVELAKNENFSVVSVNTSLYAIEVYKRLGFIATDTEQQKNGIRFVPMKHILG